MTKFPSKECNNILTSIRFEPDIWNQRMGEGPVLQRELIPRDSRGFSVSLDTNLEST